MLLIVVCKKSAMLGKVAGRPGMGTFVHKMITCDVITGVKAIEIKLHMLKFMVTVAL